MASDLPPGLVSSQPAELARDCVNPPASRLELVDEGALLGHGRELNESPSCARLRRRAQLETARSAWRLGHGLLAFLLLVGRVRDRVVTQQTG